jgi:hypothetical protein
MFTARGFLHRLNFAARLFAIDQVTTPGLQITLFDVGRQRAAFLVGPVFLGVLSLQSAAQNLFGVGITAAGGAVS